MIKDLPHPYKKELETCTHLVNYCHQLKRKAGIESGDADEAARLAQQQLLADANREQVQKKLTDGKLMEASSRDESS